MKAYTNMVDTIIAENLDDLPKVLSEYEPGLDYDPDEWVEVEPGKEEIIFWFDDDWEYAKQHEVPSNCKIEERDGKHFVTAPIEVWIEKNGRGVLCSTEF